MSDEKNMEQEEIVSTGHVKWGLLVLVLLLFVVAAFLVIPKNGATLGNKATTVPEQPQALAQQPAPVNLMAVSSKDLTKATLFVEANNSFTGYKPIRGGNVIWAHKGTTAVFSRTLPTDPSTGTPNQCVSYTITSGVPSPVLEDATMLSCQQSTVSAKVDALYNPYN